MSQEQDELGHVWDGGALLGEGREVCKRCGWFRKGEKAKEPCTPAKIRTTDTE